MSENMQRTCNQVATDLISRQVAIKAICEDGTWLESQGCTEITMAERKQRDADILGELPSAEPKRKTGKTLAEEVERIKREITDIFAEQMGVQLEVTVDECKQAHKDFADMRVGDTIYRQAAIDAVENCEPGEELFMIMSLPSAERKGKWIDITRTGGDFIWKCSECGEPNLEDTYFCPNCGSRNREEKKE